MRPAASFTRRSVLAGGLLAVAGCHHTAPRPKPAAVSPDAAALNQARVTERRLIAAYDAAIATATGDTTDLTAGRATHAAHLASLGGTTTAPPEGVPPSSNEIDGLLRSSVSTLQGSAVAAVAGHDAAVLASIAAAHMVSANSVTARD